MTNYSLRARILILILAPTLLVGLLLSSFFVVHRYNDLQSQLENAGASIIEPLAASSEYIMNIQNRRTLNELVNLLHRRNSAIVRGIAIFDSDNKLFVSSNTQSAAFVLKIADNETLPSQLTVTRRAETLILRIPILLDNIVDEDGAINSAFHPQIVLGYVAMELDLKSVQVQQYREIFTASLMLIVCIAIAMIFAYHLMRDVTGPIRNMLTTIDRIRQGQLNSRVEGHMLGELDVLKNGINAMARSLTAYNEEMQNNVDQATFDLRETLDQLEIQNVELGLAKKRAQEAVRIKSEFLANMSHELRTPLNGVIGFTRLMLKTELSSTQRDYLQTIERSASNLLSIINEVLDYSKLEAGKLLLENIPFPLRSTLDETITLLAHAAHEKSLELTINIHNNVPDNVIGDPLRLQQVITNLAGNAIKFTGSGNVNIEVIKRATGNNNIQIEFQVHDSGIGISENQQSNLFNSFRQADASISRRHGGTGLGLTITQKLVHEMGGDISFHSKLNCGSTFWFNINFDLSGPALFNPYPLEKLAGKSLAYVEENHDARESMLHLLASTPLTITHSPTLERLPNKKYDILLMGVGLHEPPEFETTKLNHILAISDYRILALPCQAIIYTEQFKSQGINQCLLKPLTSVRLYPALLASHIESPEEIEAPYTLDVLPMRVMAVDDNPANLKLIGALLREKVQQVVLCQNATQALEQAKKHSFDLILMDIQMPDIDGIRASILIRQQPLHHHTPVVAVTAHVMEDQKQKLQQADINEFLAKPIEEEKLDNLLTRYLASSQRLSNKTLRVPSVSDTDIDTEASFDWPLALKQASGKASVAREMIVMLLAYLPEVSEQLEAAPQIGDSAMLGQIIHKLHGSCSYSGVPRMKKLCLLLETSLRNGMTVEALLPEILELQDEITNVIRQAQAYLDDH